MPIFSRVLIVGTGFMGNALANALFHNRVVGEICAVEPNEAFRRTAEETRCYTEIRESIEKIEPSPELAVVCSPVETVAPLACQLLEMFPAALVTDIASVKQMVVDQVQQHAGENVSRFIGGHPITGSDRSGPIQPPKSIFTDRSFVITPQDYHDEVAIRSIEGLWDALGSHVFRLTPLDHDRLLGMTSHMPHAVASALSAALDPEELEFCGTGIRDTIRIAKSNPLLWKQIFVHNRESVLQAIGRFQQVFDDLRNSLESGSIEELVSILEKGQKNRDALGN